MSAALFTSLAPQSARAKVQSDLAVVGEWVFVAGQLPIDLQDDAAAVPDGMEAQARRVFANVEAVLQSAGLGKQDIVAVQVRLLHLERFLERFDAVYARFFDMDVKPVRGVAGVVALTRGALVEMDVVARRRG